MKCWKEIQKKPWWSYKQYDLRKTCSTKCQWLLRKWIPLSTETKKKLSDKLMWRDVWDQVRNNLRTMNIWKTQTKEHIQNSLLWRWITEESKLKTKKKNHDYRYFYGIKNSLWVTKEKYDQMFAEQNWLCKICNRPDTRRLCVDHCHKTMKIRWLLCKKCNSALWLMEDNIDYLFNMITYIKNV